MRHSSDATAATVGAQRASNSPNRHSQNLASRAYLRGMSERRFAFVRQGGSPLSLRVHLFPATGRGPFCDLHRAAGNNPPIKYLWASRDSDERLRIVASIIRAYVGESRAASDRACAHSARRSGVARMYDQTGGAREMAREAYLFARFEPLLE